MLPTVDEAIKELEIAGILNPGPWVEHSMNTGAAAKYIAEKVPGLDSTKAYICGLLHDIGRRAGITDIPTHVYDGYKYSMEKGWDEVARICMTHSYLRMQDEFCYEPETEHERAIKDYIMNCGEPDDYDKLIQLCDSLATDYGFVILEKRFVDVTRRYGIMEGYIKGWEVAFKIKEDFEERMGCSIYDVLPDIGKTSLLTPKSWKPNSSSSNKISAVDGDWMEQRETVKLKPIVEEDIEIVWKMQVDAFSELLEKYKDFDMSPAGEKIDKLNTRFKQPWTTYYFIMVDNEKVGGMRVVDKNDGSRKRISPIWIMPEYRNKGYAQQAILAAERIHGANHWCLDTILQEKGNLHLYEKLGYHQTGQIDKINDRMDIVYYEKD